MDLPDVLKEHEVCEFERCMTCPSMRKTADAFHWLGVSNQRNLTVTKMWQTTAMRRTSFVETYMDLQHGEMRERENWTLGVEQQVNHYIVDGHHVTESSSWWPGAMTEYDELYEEMNHIVHVDGVFVATYRQALRSCSRKDIQNVGGYTGIIALAAARHIPVREYANA